MGGRSRWSVALTATLLCLWLPLLHSASDPSVRAHPDNSARTGAETSLRRPSRAISPPPPTRRRRAAASPRAFAPRAPRSRADPFSRRVRPRSQEPELVQLSTAAVRAKLQVRPRTPTARPPHAS